MAAGWGRYTHAIVREIFKALGDAHRFEMVRRLLGGPSHIQALADAIGITQPAVSRHARVLQRAGVVDIVRSGRRTYLQCPPRSASPDLRLVLRTVASSGPPIPADGAEGHPHGRTPGQPAPAPVEPRGQGARPPVRDTGDLEDFLL